MDNKNNNDWSVSLIALLVVLAFGFAVWEEMYSAKRHHVYCSLLGNFSPFCDNK